MSEIEIYETDNQRFDVRMEAESVWLTQKQMGELFGTTPENVLMHLKNIFQDKELEEFATAKDFLAVRREGARQVKRRLARRGLDELTQAVGLLGRTLVRQETGDRCRSRGDRADSRLRSDLAPAAGLRRRQTGPARGQPAGAGCIGC